MKKKKRKQIPQSLAYTYSSCELNVMHNKDSQSWEDLCLKVSLRWHRHTSSIGMATWRTEVSKWIKTLVQFLSPSHMTHVKGFNTPLNTSVSTSIDLDMKSIAGSVTERQFYC